MNFNSKINSQIKLDSVVTLKSHLKWHHLSLKFFQKHWMLFFYTQQCFLWFTAVFAPVVVVLISISLFQFVLKSKISKIVRFVYSFQLNEWKPRPPPPPPPTWASFFWNVCIIPFYLVVSSHHRGAKTSETGGDGWGLTLRHPETDALWPWWSH